MDGGSYHYVSRRASLRSEEASRGPAVLWRISAKLLGAFGCLDDDGHKVPLAAVQQYGQLVKCKVYAMYGM
jgi:hypothetical protein